MKLWRIIIFIFRFLFSFFCPRFRFRFFRFRFRFVCYLRNLFIYFRAPVVVDFPAPTRPKSEYIIHNLCRRRLHRPRRAPNVGRGNKSLSLVNKSLDNAGC